MAVAWMMIYAPVFGACLIQVRQPAIPVVGTPLRFILEYIHKINLSSLAALLFIETIISSWLA
jgi:hypothetical protein